MASDNNDADMKELAFQLFLDLMEKEGLRISKEDLYASMEKEKCTGLTQEEISAINTMTTDEWFEWMAERIEKRKASGSPQEKIVGMVPATDEERLHLMKTVLHLTDEQARGLLKRMNERKPPYIKIDEEGV